MTHWAPRSLLLALCLLAAGLVPARVAAQNVVGKTYCVGGFEWTSFGPTRRQCEASGGGFLGIMPWHFHTFVRGPDRKCRECWDEVDDTCITTFLQDYPQFQTIDGYACLRVGALPPEGEVIRLTATGERVVEADRKPEPPPAVDVRAEIHRVSPGPYAVGDAVQIGARAVGSDGVMRPVRGGEIVVSVDGSVVERVAVVSQPDGTATGAIRIPSGGKVSVAFEPVVGMGSNETLGKVDVRAASFEVSPCRLRGVVLSPQPGAVVLGGEPIELSGRLRTAQGSDAPQSALSSGTRVVFVVSGEQAQTVPADIEAGGLVRARFQLKSPAQDMEPISVRLLGEGGAGDLCPAEATDLQLTRLGVGVDVERPGPDTVCYRGMPCPLALRLRLPSSEPARSVAQSFVSSPDLSVTVSLHGATPGEVKAVAGDPLRRAAELLPSVLGNNDVFISVRSGTRELKVRRQVKVREPLLLKLPAAVDLGTVRAGTAQDDTCQPLDFSSSRGIEEQPLQVRYVPPPGCVSKLGVILADGTVVDFDEELELTIDPMTLKMPVCLETPACEGDASEVPGQLTVQAKSPDFPSARASVAVHYRVEGLGFLTCHGWWLGLAGAGLGVLFVAYGFAWPERFGLNHSVKVALTEAALPRAASRRISDLPGGRAGWYRSASAGMRADGQPTRRAREATVVFVAFRGEVKLRACGGIEELNRRSRAFEPVDLTAHPGGLVARRNVIYRTGNLYVTLT